MAELKRWDEILKRIKDIRSPVVAEIGVDNGKTSNRLLSAHKGLTLYMVDWWKKPPAGNSYIDSGASIPGKDNEYFKKTYQNCRNIAAKYYGRGIIVRGESTRIAKEFDNNFLDLVFIDADHSYIGCRNDIIAWMPKVKTGGWICGHDYNHPDQGEVKRAVDEIFHNRKIILGGNRTWFARI